MEKRQKSKMGQWLLKYYPKELLELSLTKILGVMLATGIIAIIKTIESGDVWHGILVSIFLEGLIISTWFFVIILIAICRARAQKKEEKTPS